jgi:aminoglycoside phosphotransferase family enzyme/predicted kinase
LSEPAEAASAADQQHMVAALLKALREPPAQLRSAPEVALIETHISFVLLAGDEVYKIKKAVNLGFLDFTTLGARRFYCEEELRLNRRLAPALYLGVLPVTGSLEHPALGGQGAAIDWAVHMRAFAQDGVWDRIAQRGALLPEHIDELVESLVAFHRDAAVAGPSNPFGRPDHVRAPMTENLQVLGSLLTSPDERALLAELAAWEAESFATLRSAFGQRLRERHVRECHGDLHLGNVAQVAGKPTMFDCLEFSPALRWTDVMSDLAFMAMDLNSHGLHRLSNRLVNRYVEVTCDHAGLRVLRYYSVHRALVRAKVAALRDAQREVAPSGEDRATAPALAPAPVPESMPADATANPGDPGPAGKAHRSPVRPLAHAVHHASAPVRHYLDVALSSCRAAAPVLMVTHGFSGSGKTALTQSLLELCGAIRLRSDVERKWLFGMPASARSASALHQNLYSPHATEATQARLRELAEIVVTAGFSVILDATFLQHSHREKARELAERLGLRFVIIDFQAHAQVLRERVRLRGQQGTDASEADVAVLDDQLAHAQALQPDELASVHAFDSEPAIDEARMAERWAPLLQRVGLLRVGDGAAPGRSGDRPR